MRWNLNNAVDVHCCSCWNGWQSEDGSGRLNNIKEGKVVAHALKGGVTSLVVGLLLQPTTGIPAQVKTTALVVHEDGDGEGNGWQPPHESANTRQKRRSENLFQIFKVEQGSYLRGYILRPLSIPGV